MVMIGSKFPLLQVEELKAYLQIIITIELNVLKVSFKRKGKRFYAVL